MYIVIYKTIIIYFIILILVRVMGKREIGQLSPFDFVVAIMIAEMAVFPIEEREISIIEGIIPIILLVMLEIFIAYISLKSNFLRGIITGRPQILIENGKINYENLQRTRYNINDLLMQLRIKNIFNVDEVELAILEMSGELSVVENGSRPYGFPIVIDGKILHNENISKVDKEWIEKEIACREIDFKDILLATVDRDKTIKIYPKD